MGEHPPRVKRRRVQGSALLACAAAFLLFCAAPAPARAQPTTNDPLERVNRAIFRFNDTLDVWLFEPIAKGWNFLLPDEAVRGVDRFFDNLRFPIVFVNSLLQGKPGAAHTAFWRFSLNTLLGAGGILDVASSTGLERVDEDFGQTLGYWGVPSGAYLVLPLLGPSSVRDGVGLAADSAARVWPYFVPTELVWSAGAVEAVNTRTLLIETVEMAKRDSLDYYAAVRDAYLQRREALVEDRRSRLDERDEDLYYPELEDENDLYFPEED